MSVFEDQQPIRKPIVVARRSWPIALAMALGAKNETQAGLIVLGIICTLIVGAFLIYNNKVGEIADNFPPTIDDLTNEQIYDLLNSGVDTEHLSPKTREELRERGIVI